MGWRFHKAAMLGAALVLWPAVSFAGMLDLKTSGASGWINSAYFLQIDPQSTGTGVIAPFLQIDDNTPNGSIVEGYNTTANGVFDNKNTDQWNHELFLASVPRVQLNGVGPYYREFFLDINEPKNGTSPLLSLDELQIFQSGTPNQNTTGFTGGVVNLSGSLVYRLDGNLSVSNPDNWIELDYALNHGQGSGDMLAYIPDSVFTSADPYVYLYARFGERLANDGNFEEWAVRLGTRDVVPEPATMVLMLSGLAGLALRRWRG